VREAARLHSYPDWFRFHVTKWHGFREIGNSVPPLLGRSVAAEVILALGRSPVKPEAPIHHGDVSLLSLDMSAASRYFELERIPISTRNRTKTSTEPLLYAPLAEAIYV
jgi:DNA (cytosine-5)-methyltransferase 1